MLTGDLGPGYREATDSRTGLVCWRSSGSGMAQILPNVSADLIFTGGGLQLAGYDTVTHDIDRGAGETTYGVRLPAGLLPHLLHDSAATAVDGRVPIGVAAGDVRLRRLIDELPTTPDIARTLVDITGILVLGADVDPQELRTTAAVMSLTDRSRSVAAVAEDLGWSQRRLHRFSLATFGMSASTLRSLCRFHRAHRLLSAGTQPAEAAQLTGYADQAHLTRHIRRFASTTPSRVVGHRAG